jgi:hypothetical protein
LDEVEQNIVIYQWRADQLFADAEGRNLIDLRANDKSRYFAIAEFNNCFIIYRLVFVNYYGHRFTNKYKNSQRKSII